MRAPDLAQLFIQAPRWPHRRVYLWDRTGRSTYAGQTCPGSRLPPRVQRVGKRSCRRRAMGTTRRVKTFKLSTDPAFTEKLDRRRGVVPASAGQGRRTVRGREEPDSGARPYTAGSADEARTLRHDDPRLQAQRHDDLVRGVERADRQGHRPMPPNRSECEDLAERVGFEPEAATAAKRLNPTLLRRIGANAKIWRREWDSNPR